MNGNYEISRQLARERVESRLRDAEVHRQARFAKGDSSKGPSVRIVLSTLAGAGRLVSTLISRLGYRRHEPDPVPDIAIESK